MLPRPPRPHRAASAPISAKALSLKLQELSRGVGLEEFDDTPEARRIARLAADRLLLEEAQVHGYTGEACRKLQDALAAYAFQIMKAWLTSGKIFRVCLDKGFGAPPRPPRRFDDDDIVGLANLVIAEALTRFVTLVLRPNRWDPLQGASLTTYFVGMCVRVFNQIYRPWCTDARRARHLIAGGLEILPERIDGSVDALGMLSAEALLNELARPEDRRLLALLAADYDDDEIGEELNLSTRAVNSRIFRMRKLWKRKP